jgi:predicted DNA-binding transcriptional regulator AlpA
MNDKNMKGDAARTQMDPLLTVEDLERLLRVDRRTLSRLWKSGRFPKPLKLGGSNRWRAEDVARAIDRLGEGTVVAVGKEEVVSPVAS